MANFNNSSFNFKIRPEDSEFLKNWNQLKSDSDFKDELAKVKAQVKIQKKDAVSEYLLISFVENINESHALIWKELEKFSNLFLEELTQKNNIFQKTTFNQIIKYKTSFQREKNNLKSENNIFEHASFSLKETEIYRKKDSVEDFIEVDAASENGKFNKTTFVDNSYAF